MLSKINQTEEDKYSMIPLTCELTETAERWWPGPGQARGRGGAGQSAGFQARDAPRVLRVRLQ